VTPVPLDLPLRPSEAALLGNLILDHAERKPLTDEVRNRLAARASVLQLETIRPYFGSLERDPVHPSAYYLAVDAAGEEPWLLYLALATAPTSSIFYKPLLIGRTRRANGPEMVINAIPFGPSQVDELEKFAGHINAAFLPRPQGTRTAIAAPPSPAAFDAFRTILKRTGKNLAAICVPAESPIRDAYAAGLWAAIRAGWREGYTAGIEIPVGAESLDSAKDAIRQAAAFSAFTIDASSIVIEQLHEFIRQTRSVQKAGKSFDLEVSFEGANRATTADDLASCLAGLRDHGHAPQLVSPHLAETAQVVRQLEELGPMARQFQCTLSIRGRADFDENILRQIARATAGRLHYKLTGELAERAGFINFIAEHLVG
jgi:hypothetical protein